MDVVCLVNYYPIRQEDLSPAIEQFWQALEDHPVEMEKGELETVVRGDDADVLAALSDAYNAAHALGPGAMTVTVKDDRSRSLPE